ncbi:sulfite exporter TauE/SafE family protein [Halovulum dunhuangense]|uniref:Probable membrane transporter protein n=1 Tax=Halovulum dunhuangense TaxID=1505036 RepID=A0A849L3C0_9RHOB|nr:sulfite exporter TauE/SafE family protein [Halovulum dunhuangense]NNU80846.1 sulfite exporter TauE/SafE family protein [Halovulum dunhuangense]
MTEILTFLLAGVVGGAVNTAAGGAKLFVFPMLLAAGLPPVAANATSIVALWPAQMPAVWVQRASLPRDRKILLGHMAMVIVGALLGVYALISVGEQVFVSLVPFFLAIAVGTILFGERLGRWVRSLPVAGALPGLVLLFVCGAYGGFFGAGVGFMLVAALLVSGMTDIRAANAHKNLLATVASTTAVLPLTLSGLVDWRAAVLVAAGGIVGGYAGALLLKLIPPFPLKVLISVMGIVLTLAFLYNN